MQADEVSIPRIIFANKMDREGASLTRTVEHIARELRCSPLVLQVPVEGSGASAAVVDVLGESVLSWSSDDGKSMSTVPVAESGTGVCACAPVRLCVCVCVCVARSQW